MLKLRFGRLLPVFIIVLLPYSSRADHSRDNLARWRMEQFEDYYLSVDDRMLAEKIFSQVPSSSAQALPQLIWVNVHPSEDTKALIEEIGMVLRPDQKLNYWQAEYGNLPNETLIFVNIYAGFLDKHGASRIFPELMAHLPASALVFVMDHASIHREMEFKHGFEKTVTLISLSASHQAHPGHEHSVNIFVSGEETSAEELISKVMTQIPIDQQFHSEIADRVFLLGRINIQFGEVGAEKREAIIKGLTEIFESRSTHNGQLYDAIQATVSFRENRGKTKFSGSKEIILQHKPRLTIDGYGGYLFLSLPRETYEIVDNKVRFDGDLTVDVSELPDLVQDKVVNHLQRVLLGREVLIGDLIFQMAESATIKLKRSNRTFVNIKPTIAIDCSAEFEDRVWDRVH